MQLLATPLEQPSHGGVQQFEQLCLVPPLATKNLRNRLLPSSPPSTLSGFSCPPLKRDEEETSQCPILQGLLLLSSGAHELAAFYPLFLKDHVFQTPCSCSFPPWLSKLPTFPL